MTVRWSNPSGSIGVFRFKVWPTDTTDSYSAAQLAANFDKIDAIFGVPSSGVDWPPTEGIDGGIYELILALQGKPTATAPTPPPVNSPVGAIWHFWSPPGIAAVIPTGWAEMNGQTLVYPNHNFPGGGSVTLPDLRGKYIVSADSTVPVGQSWALAGAVNIDLATGAPGLGFASGSNQSILGINQMPNHNHGGGAHNHTLTDSGHTHGVIDAGHNHGGFTGTPNMGIAENNAPVSFLVPDVGTEYNNQPTQNHVHTIATDNAHVTIQSSLSGISITTSSSLITSQGSGTAFDNRPGSIAFITIIRVL